jgi:hypothetical protein
LHDLSNISANSKLLEESVKSSHRPPINVPGLTEYLVQSHYKRYGVFSKNETELFKYWKEHISIDHKEKRKQQRASKASLLDSQISSGDKQGTMTGVPLFNSQTKKETYVKGTGFEMLRKFGLCEDKDVAYTLHNDLEAEDNEKKKLQG